MGEVTDGKEYRHIVDVDGLLIGIDEPAISAGKLLNRAGARGEGRLVQLIGEHERRLDCRQPIRLNADELLVFRSEAF